MAKSPKVCIIGSEGWGSAIATAVCKNVLDNDFHPRVHLYVYDEIVRSNHLAEVINERHENVKYLPGIQLPENLIAVNDLVCAAQEADILIFAAPHDFIKSYCNILAGNVKSDAYAISLIKGFEHIGNGEISLYSQTITKKLGIPCYSMMNANCAMEMAQGKLCEITIGCDNKEHAEQLSSLIQTENCMVVLVDDVHGVELCNTLKDLVALSAGFIDGLRLGDNARVACLHLGLKEMMRFIKNFNSTTKVSTCFESCGLANSVATAYVDKNVIVAKSLVTKRNTIQEIESTLLNGRKLHGPIIAQDIYSYLEKQDMLEEYPLFSIVHQICLNKVQPEAIVDIIRYHPDLKSSTITHLQEDEFSAVPSSQQHELDNAIESINETRKALVNKMSPDDFELELDNAEGIWHSNWDHANDQQNCMEQVMTPLQKSQVATGAANQEPERGSVEFCFEMGSKKDNPDICLSIKDNILGTAITNEDLSLMGSHFTPTRRLSNREVRKLINPRLQPIGIPRSGTVLIDRVMSSNNKGEPGQFQDCDNCDKYDERKQHEFENKSEMQSQPTVASSRNDSPHSTDSIDSQSRPPNFKEHEGMCEMQLFDENLAEDELVAIIKKKEREALEKNRLETCSKENRLMSKGALARERHSDAFNNAPHVNAKAYKYDYKISINSRKIPIDRSPKDELVAQENEAMKLKRRKRNTNYSFSSSMPYIGTTDPHFFVESSPYFTNVEGSPSDFERGALDTTCKAKDYDSDFKTYQEQPMYNKTMNASNRKNLVENGPSMSRRVITDDLGQLGITSHIPKRHKGDEPKKTSKFHKCKDFIHEAEDTILDNEIPYEIMAKERGNYHSDERPTNEATNEMRIGEKIEREDGRVISEKYRNSGYMQNLEEESPLEDRLTKHRERQGKESDKRKQSRKFGRHQIGENDDFTISNSNKKYPEPEFSNTQESYIRDEYIAEYNKLEDAEDRWDTTSKRYNSKDYDSIKSEKQEEKNEEPSPKEIQVQMKGAETYPLDTAPSEIESEPKTRRITSDAADDTKGNWSKEDKKHQYKVSLMAEKENVPSQSNARTSAWDWLLDTDNADDTLEDMKSKKVSKSHRKTDMSKYRHLLEFIGKRDKNKGKTNFDGKREQSEIVPRTDMDDIRYSWPISTKSPVDPPTGSDDLIMTTESEPTISKPATEHGNYDERTEELATSSTKDWQQEEMSDSMPTEKPMLPIEKQTDRAEHHQRKKELEEDKSHKRFSKIMTKGRNKKRQSNEQLVDYDGANPYKKDRDVLMYLQEKLRDSNSHGNILEKPFHPPLNPRVRIPRPPFDVREHEYHTLSFRPIPNIQYKMLQKPSIPLSQSKHASASVSKLPRHTLKLPPSMMRSSVMALELGVFAALLSRCKGGRK